MDSYTGLSLDPNVDFSKEYSTDKDIRISVKALKQTTLLYHVALDLVSPFSTTHRIYDVVNCVDFALRTASRSVVADVIANQRYGENSSLYKDILTMKYHLGFVNDPDNFSSSSAQALHVQKMTHSTLKTIETFEEFVSKYHISS